MSLDAVGSWFGGLVKDGMAGYIEVEKAKAGNNAVNTAFQDATFDSPEVDENPTARANQSVAQTAATVGGGIMQSPTVMLLIGGVALVGAVMLIKSR